MTKITPAMTTNIKDLEMSNDALERQWIILENEFGGDRLVALARKYMERAGLTGKRTDLYVYGHALFGINFDLRGFPKKTYRYAGEIYFNCDVYGAVEKTLAYNPRKIPLKDAPVIYKIMYRRITGEDKAVPPKENPFNFNPFAMQVVEPSIRLERNLNVADLLSTIRKTASNAGLQFKLSGIEYRTPGPYFSLTHTLLPTLAGWQQGADVIGTIDKICRLYLEKHSGE